jgi:hypothetical protein
MTRVAKFCAVSSTLALIALSTTGANAATITPHVNVVTPKVTIKPPLAPGHIQTSGVSASLSSAKSDSDGKAKPDSNGKLVLPQTIKLTNGAIVSYKTYHGDANTTGGTTVRQRRPGEEPLK